MKPYLAYKYAKSSSYRIISICERAVFSVTSAMKGETSTTEKNDKDQGEGTTTFAICMYRSRQRIWYMNNRIREFWIRPFRGGRSLGQYQTIMDYSRRASKLG